MKRILADLPIGAIIRYRGDWGVVCTTTWYRSGWRVVNFWFDGRHYIPDIAEVEVLPQRRPYLRSAA